MSPCASVRPSVRVLVRAMRECVRAGKFTQKASIEHRASV